MADKVLAKDYFKDSILFDAKVVSDNPNSSAKSSTVSYELTCKKCKGFSKRRGNSSVLKTCSECKREWDREENEIIEPVKKVTSKKVKPVVVESDEEPEVPKPVPSRRAVTQAAIAAAKEEENQPLQASPRRKITVESITDLLTKGASEKPADTPAAAVPDTKPADDTYAFDGILDYYDERLEDMWHRYYYVKWTGYDEPTFVLDEDFTDQKVVTAFEDGLPEVERFKVMFPKTSRKNKGAKHAVRTKIDVLKDRGDIPDKEVTETISTNAIFKAPLPPLPTQIALPPTILPTPPTIPLPEVPNTPCIEVKQSTFTHIRLQKGQFYQLGDYLFEAV